MRVERLVPRGSVQNRLQKEDKYLGGALSSITELAGLRANVFTAKLIPEDNRYSAQ